MSGGTTGKSRPTFYTAWDREVGGLLLARQFYMQGLRPGRRGAQLVGLRFAQRRLRLRRGAAPMAQLRRNRHLYRQRDPTAARSSWRLPTRPRPS